MLTAILTQQCRRGANENRRNIMNRLFAFRFLTGIAPLFIAAKLCAAPLAWFPGPPLTVGGSGAATTTLSGGDNMFIGGDLNYYPEGLAATNSNWTIFVAGLASTATIGAGAAGSGDPIMFYGGTDGTTPTSAVIGYSQSGDGQTTLTPMSTARAYFGYVSDRNGNTYAIGGLGASGNPLATCETYNQDNNNWTAIKSLPAARYDFPAVFDHTNLIYIFGGRTTTGGAGTTTVQRYSVSANTWTTLAAMPVAVADSVAAYGSDGKIYVVGGVTGGVATDTVQIYNPSANSWTISTPLPEALTASTMGVDSLGRLIVMGGMDTNGNDTADVWRSQELNQPDTVPVFTKYPASNAIYLQPYNSSISATANPQPTYVVVSGPDGLQVDTFSGAITWTPLGNQVGSDPVTIRATNYNGYADYNFTITVPNPPPTVPTNLTVVSFSDNSVTLAWGPESYVVGVTTYSVAIPHPWHSPRGSGGGVNYQTIATNLQSPTITISGLTPSTGYSFAVNAKGPGGTSGYTSISFGTTGPQGPTNLLVTGVTSTSVSLQWNIASGPAQNPLYAPITSYTIMERIASPAQNIPTVTNLTGTNGTVTGLTPGKSHIWFISGVDAAGNASPITFYYVVVANPVPAAAKLGSAVVSAGSGGFQFSASEGSSTLQTVLIQATTNPADPASWVQIGSVFPSANPFTFIDTNSSQYPNRFYRVVSP
jgi:hypothetical protein